MHSDLMDFYSTHKKGMKGKRLSTVGFALKEQRRCIWRQLL